MRDLSDLANRDYVDRINRAIDHITQHLDGSLQLDDVARVACFSPYHFHRIFRSLVGETLHAFVKRVRLERVLHMMAHQPRTSLTEIALACGFSSSSDLSRSFRNEYGVPPSVFDLTTYRRAHRDEMNVRFRLASSPAPDPGAFAVVLRELPPRRVAYLRVFQPYSGGVPATAARMVALAAAHGLRGGQWLGYQWDDPEIVPLDRCRYDIGVELPPGAAIAEATVTEFPAMTVAEIEISGSIDLEMRALDWIYKSWLPNSRYVPAHQPMFEAWRGEPFAHGHEHFELRLQLPVER